MSEPDFDALTCEVFDNDMGFDHARAILRRAYRLGQLEMQARCAEKASSQMSAWSLLAAIRALPVLPEE